MLASLGLSARSTVVLAAALALGGCLISEEPLLNDENARAKPLAAGPHQSCQYEEGGEESECMPLNVVRDGFLYRFEPEGEDEPTFVRLRSIGDDAYLAQMWGEDDGDYFYFYADKAEGALRMIMIQCEDIPEALREELSASGDLEVEDDASVCNAKTLKGAEKSAKAYQGPDAAPARSTMVISKAAE